MLDSAVMQKIKIIAKLKAENRKLKERIDFLERKNNNLECGVAWDRIRRPMKI